MKKGKAFDFMLYYGNKIPTELLMRHIKLKSETSNRLRTSALLLACFDGRPGGTMSTIVYAERQGLKTVIIEL